MKRSLRKCLFGDDRVEINAYRDAVTEVALLAMYRQWCNENIVAWRNQQESAERRVYHDLHIEVQSEEGVVALERSKLLKECGELVWLEDSWLDNYGETTRIEGLSGEELVRRFGIYDEFVKQCGHLFCKPIDALSADKHATVVGASDRRKELDKHKEQRGEALRREAARMREELKRKEP